MGSFAIMVTLFAQPLLAQATAANVVGAVSYTHLDVYKRQGTLNAQIKLVVASRPSAYGLKRAEAAGIQTLTLSKDVYADPIQADEVIAHELLAAGCAVSYTHLDVYKRQASRSWEVRTISAPCSSTSPRSRISSSLSTRCV